MKPDDFEQRLQRKPLRQIPIEWRAEILLKARLANEHPVPHWRGFLSSLNSQLSTLLWPSPKAWYGLAAIWLALLVVNAATADKTNAIAQTLPRPAPEMMIAWREQERLLTELIGPREMPIADRPKTAMPRPRSERRSAFLMT